MSESKEKIILTGLVNRSDYKSHVFLNIKPEYFEMEEHSLVFKLMREYYDNYEALPNEEAFGVILESKDGIPQSIFQKIESFKKIMYSEKAKEKFQTFELSWLKDMTLDYCKQRSVYLGVTKAVELLDSKDTQKIEGIPQILQESLNVHFDTRVGHDYIEDAEERYEFYTRVESKIRLPLDMLNKVTHGGLTRKTLNFYVAPTGVGKTMILADHARYFLTQGHNVLYVTLEMEEKKIAQRIDANIMDIELKAFKNLPKEEFMSRANTLKSKTMGKLIIREYPATYCTVNTLAGLFEELYNKKRFKPDILIVDYMGNMRSIFKKDGDTTYVYMKSVTEELRGFCMKHDIVGITAHQINREGTNASDFGLTEVSDSAGIAMTADLMIGLISTEEMEEEGQIRMKQLKNRYGALYPNSWMINVDRSKMRLSDADDSTTLNDNAYQPNQTKPGPSSSSNVFDFS